jgi:glycosyltransferase involved in cell wall biosynthesis
VSNQLLLTVSGTVPGDIAARIAAGEHPRVDYLELARNLGADLLDVARARRLAGPLASLLEHMGGVSLLLAFACARLRGRYKAILTDGEQVGLPLAALLKYTPGARPRHLMITHTLSVPKKTFFLDRLGVQSHIDRFICYASWQKRFIEQRWQLPASKLCLTPFMVDQQFFAPEQATPAPRSRPLICAVGRERRDYPTLLRAVDGLDIEVVIVPGSHWSRRGDSSAGQALPPNVRVRSLSAVELRQLYADSSFVVMPLERVDFQAGVTSILEAMAMERAVLCSRAPGQTDIITHCENGLYVPSGDATALRVAIVELLADRERAARMGTAGRRLVEREINLDRYVERLRALVSQTLAERIDQPHRSVSTARSL